MADPKTIDEWIARDAVAFDLAAPASVDAATDALVAALGDVELLGLGEMMHGSEEILLLRNRLFRRLVASHGYTAIAVESSFPRGRLVDDFVNGRGDAETFADVRDGGFSHGFGAFDTSRALVEWMREHNATATTKLRFAGFDSPTEMGPSDSPRQLLDVALAFLKTVDGPRARGRRERMDALLGDEAQWLNPAAAFDPAKGIGCSPNAVALRAATEELIADLRLRQPEFAGDALDRYEEAVHCARHAREMLTYHAAIATPSDDRLERLLGLRDAMMADNLAYLVERERRRGGKVFAFAHNSHLKRGRAAWQMGPYALQWWPAGAIVASMPRLRYAVVGAGLGTSEANGIAAPEAGTLEDRLVAVPGPVRFVPTRGARSLRMPAARSGGKNPSYFPFTADSVRDFDAMLVLDTTTYTRGGPSGGAR